MIDSSREISSKVRVVYFSSVTENTKRFVEKVGCESERIPVYPNDPPLKVDYEYVLITPTYGGGGAKGAVPKQVMKFLKDEENRALCRGVISAGNTNFGEGYCLAGKLIANKLSVPNLYRFELLGTPKEVSDVKNGLNIFWSNFVEKNKSAEYSNT